MTKMYLLKQARQAGFTLIELLISMVLGLILIGGIYSVFTENARTSQFVQATSRVQENGRFALSYMMQELRMVGYMGCMSNIDLDDPAFFVSTLNTGTTNSDAEYYFDLTKGQLEVIDYIGSTVTLPPLNVDDPIPKEGTDVILVRGLSSADYTLDGVPKWDANGNANFNIRSTDVDLKDNDIGMLSDCQRAAVFQITSVLPVGGGGPSGRTKIIHNKSNGGLGDGPGNSGMKLSDGPFNENASMQKFTSTLYYIAPAQDDASILSLWQKNATADAFELVTGIEDLEIHLGVDTDNDGVPNSIVRPPLADTSDVVTIDIRIRANSIDPVGTQMIVRDFTSTVQLRNRGL